MKKLLSMMAMALLVMMGCSDEEIVKGGYANGSIQATFEDGIATSRLAIGEGNVLTWTEGDAIVMFGDAVTGGTFTLDAGSDGEQTGSFSGIIPDGTLKGAAFPASDDLQVDEYGTLTMTLPSELTYDASGKCNLPMWASFSSLDMPISFKHLGALLKIDFSNIPAGYGKFIVEADKPLSGKFTANISMEEPFLSASEDGTNNTVAVAFQPFAENAETNQCLFFVPLPVGEYAFIKVTISGEGKGDIVMATWENKLIERKNVYVSSLVYKEVIASKASDVNTAFTSLGEVSKAQVAVSGEINTTGADAGAIEIPVLENKATDVTLAFNTTPVTDVANPLVIKEAETTSTVSENSELTLDIPVTENKDTHLNLDMPNTTVNVTGGSYATITATTASNTLNIGEAVTVAKLIIQAGNVVLKGKITEAIEKAANNEDQETILYLEETAEIADEILEKLEGFIVVKFRVLERMQTDWNDNVLDYVVSQIIKNQAQGGEQGMMIAREALADDMTWRTNTWYKIHLGWLCNLNATNNNNLCTWEFYYEMINRTNRVLEALEKLNPDVLQQEQRDIYNKVKGEALSFRASQHFHLVQLYADRYVSGGGNVQDGIQYRTSTNASEWIVSTVEEVYNQIKADLDEACSLLEGVVQETPDHYDEKVAWGLKARVALTMGDYTNAAVYADKAITLAEAQGKALMTGNQLYNGFADLTTKTQEAMLADVPDRTVYFYSFYSYMSWNRSSTSIRQGVKCINSDTYATMAETDLRRAWWDPTGYKEDVPTNFLQVPYQNRKFTARSESDGEGDTPFMRLAEMYLLRAEALARSGQDGPAQEVFTKFQQTRDPEYVGKGNTADALIEEIMNSRRVELWGEGFRFYDLKRLHLPIKRGANFDEAFCVFLEKGADDAGWTFAKPE